jgi:ABC-type spermidine/putrescine transport system permease subunit I
VDEPVKGVQGLHRGGELASLWQRKIWWLLPLGVLALLLVIIYVLAHLSAADSEMYPTTQLMRFAHFLSC